MVKTKNKKKKINIDERVYATATLLKNFFNEFKTLYEFYLGKEIDEEEGEHYYMRVAPLKELEIAVSLYNQQTNAMAIKIYQVQELLSLSSLDLVNTMVEIDVKKLHSSTIEKRYNDITEIYID